MTDKLITAQELIEILDMSLYKYLDVHHTWVPNHTSFNGDNHLRIQNSMRNYHVNTKGWRDIAQHVSLAPDGLYITGRDFTWTPVSIRVDLNPDAFMVEMIGNFDVGHDILDGKQLDSILLLMQHFLLNDKKIRFHNEYSYKTCPGSSLNKEEMINMAYNFDKHPIYEKWQLELGDESINNLLDNGVLDTPELHKDILLKGGLPPWLIYTLFSRLCNDVLELKGKIDRLDDNNNFNIDGLADKLINTLEVSLNKKEK